MAENAAGVDAIEAWLVAKLSERLGIAPDAIDISEPFASYGLGSTEAVSLAGELAQWLGRKLSPALAYEHPTIAALARHLAASPEAPTATIALGAEREANNDPIAIIGIGCRFPGANGPASFWRMLQDGVDAIREVPADRFDLQAFYDPDPAAPGKMNTRWGGFLEEVDAFDADFFGISPREAVGMDPQQRLLLEVAWEALQDARQAPERLAGSATGIFIGIATNDYGRLQWQDLASIDAYAGTGNALSIAANRISYVFDFRGPSLAIDTACSSSLVAVHLACRSLRNGEATLALAGGVNLILSPAIAINFTKAGAMAPDGRCKSFDARADGYVRGEGTGIVVLKPLAAAVAEGDPIYAVIRGSAVNQDGRSNGLMAPSPLAQEAVLRAAYRQAGIAPGAVQYVEAHGTGTLLGDPIEAKALGAVMGIDRPPGLACALGSVKTNFGHLEAAAGIAGLIKVALALQHRQIPPSLHFATPNPLIPFDELKLSVQTALGPWPTASGPAVAGVSSFGFGGTNAHVVLEEAPAAAISDAAPEIGPYLMPLSARSPEALRSIARAYMSFLAAPGPAASLSDLCYTAGVRLGHHDHRLAATGHSPAQMIESLEAFLRGEARPGLASGRRLSSRPRKLVFVFPGQGSQWFGMGRRLMAEESVFREVIERCDAAMRPYRDGSLVAELSATDAALSRLNDIDVVQPALFAMEIAVAALWRAWGIEPHAVVGHSLGEVAAAYIAGALGLEDAVRVVCHRSRLGKRVVGQGAMATVELSVAEARSALVGIEDRVSVAASNGPTATVLSGDPAALAALIERLQASDIFCRWVKVDFASHSPQMEPLRADLLGALDGIEPRSETVPIYSTVTGERASGLDFDAAYWARNLREPVLFAAAFQRLVADGHDIFLEISPHPLLLGAMQQGLLHLGRDGAVLPSLRREEDERAILLGSLGALYALGYEVDWSLIHPSGGRSVPLPSYPWQRQHFWFEPANPRPEPAASSHSPLGRHFTSPHPAATDFWETTLDRNSLPYLDDHRIHGIAVLPAASYVAMALAAASQSLGAQPVALEAIEFRKALFLPEGGAYAMQLILSREGDGAASFHIYARAEGAARAGASWMLHATGKIRPQPDAAIVASDAGPEMMREMSAQDSGKIAGEDYYQKLRDGGIDYGPFFQSIARLWRDNGKVLGEVQVPDAAEAQIQPALIDAGLQMLGAAIAAEASESDRQGLYLPTRIDRLRIDGRPGRHLWGLAEVRDRAAEAVTGDVQLCDEAGRVAVAIEGLRFDHLGEDAGSAVVDNLDDWLYEFEWRPKELAAGNPAPSAGPASWLIFGDDDGVGEALSALLEARGDRPVRVAHGDSYEQTDGEHYRIRPERPEDMSRLIATAFPSDRPRCRFIVHLWSLDAAGPEATTVASLQADQALGCGSVLLLVQELARTESSDMPLLWLMTRGAHAAEDMGSQLSLAQSPLWGLGRVLAQEHPTFSGALVDLDPASSPPEAARQVYEEIAATDGEDQIALRQGRRYVGRLVRRAAAMPAPRLSWRTDGSYLISGGLGDLGLLVARWMVEQGARRLILLGRTRLPPRADWRAAAAGSRLARQIAAIQELESMGASVHPAAVDVADEDELRGFLDEFRAAGWPPIRGVVHAAGVLKDGLLVQLDAAALETVLRPKMLGGWLLHRLLQDERLDFFVLFSSAGSVLGQPGQGNYAAANAFLDALAHHRQAQGKPALSIDWGAWAGKGFAESPGGKRLAAHLARIGIGSITAPQGLEMLRRLLGQSAAQIVAVPVDWQQYREFQAANDVPPLLSELARESARAPERASAMREAILAADPAERRQRLQSYLGAEVARVLGLSPSKLDFEQPLIHLGLDSLMAVELKNRIAVDLKVNVPMAKFLQGFSVEQAVTQVLEQLAAAPVASTPAPGGRQNAERLLADMDQLSDDEVGALLAEMLGEGKAGSPPWPPSQPNPIGPEIT